MIQRCSNPKAIGYRYYGGKGIKVKWKRFEDFYADMADSYKRHCRVFGENNTTLERRDNDQHYCKTNCTWATIKEQMAHTSRARYLTFNGLTLIVSEWSRRTGIPLSAIHKRLKRGWPIYLILTQPSKRGIIMKYHLIK